MDLVAVYLEEYRQLYALVVYRLNALDQRIPITTAILSTVLVSVIALPPLLQVVLLVGLPPSLVWLARTTVNHARSLEDALRRIDEIEREVNTEVGRSVLVFQSSHPSRGVQVGGRTGEETVHAVLVVAAMLLAGSALMFDRLLAPPTPSLAAYSVYMTVIAWCIIMSYRRLQTYRYERREAIGSTATKRS